jgi:hypothetical protein
MLQFQQFDSNAFGIPFYRLTEPASTTLAGELAGLTKAPPFIVDAKLPAEDISNATRLMKLGFRKICVQLELECGLFSPKLYCEGAKISDRIVFPDSVIDAHARHFTFDRFALDPELSATGHERLYKQWIRNSLERGTHLVALKGENFITFKSDGRPLRIDLVSILNKRRGIGSDLLQTIFSFAEQQKIGTVKVVTECENLPALKLYMKAGFVPARFFSVFHLVQKT